MFLETAHSTMLAMVPDKGETDMIKLYKDIQGSNSEGKQGMNKF